MALTPEQQKVLRTAPDDTEEAPWMVVSAAQFWPATALATSLRIHAERHGLPWYVAGMLPIVYPRPGRRRNGQVAPDVLVAFVSPRQQAYRRIPGGGFGVQTPDAQGRLWSEVLGLFLVAEGQIVRAALPDGTRLLTHQESELGRAQEEAEVARLRAALERLRGER